MKDPHLAGHLETEHRVTVRRIDQSFRVMVAMDDLEHTHRHPFENKDRAWRLARRVRAALDDGDDLDLRHWDTEPV